MGDPWPTPRPYDRMLHYGHMPWGDSIVDGEQWKNDGGPRLLLTDHGWVEIDENGIVRTEKEGQEHKRELFTDEELEAEWNRRQKLQEEIKDKKIEGKPIYTCEMCGEVFNYPLQKARHIRLEHNLKSKE
jgi:hypothetical protein